MRTFFHYTLYASTERITLRCVLINTTRIVAGRKYWTGAHWWNTINDTRCLCHGWTFA